MSTHSCYIQLLHTTQLLPSSSPPSPLLPLLPFLPSPGFGFCYFLPRTLGDPGGEPGSHWKAKAASLSAASATAASALTITTAVCTSAICHEPLLHQPPLPPPRAPPRATPPCAPRQASRFLASASAIIATALAAITAAVMCASQQPTIKLRLWRHVQASVASESYGELRDVKLIPSMDLPSIILTFSHTTESALLQISICLSLLAHIPAVPVSLQLAVLHVVPLSTNLVGCTFVLVVFPSLHICSTLHQHGLFISTLGIHQTPCGLFTSHDFHIITGWSVRDSSWKWDHGQP